MYGTFQHSDEQDAQTIQKSYREESAFVLQKYENEISDNTIGQPSQKIDEYQK